MSSANINALIGGLIGGLAWVVIIWVFYLVTGWIVKIFKHIFNIKD